MLHMNTIIPYDSDECDCNYVGTMCIFGLVLIAGTLGSPSRPIQASQATSTDNQPKVKNMNDDVCDWERYKKNK